MTSVAKGKSEICHISFTFPITVANENFNLAGALYVPYITGYLDVMPSLWINT
jgi:hypothetical protein